MARQLLRPLPGIVVARHHTGLECNVSVSAVHVGANVGGADRRLEGGSRSRSASPRLSGGRRG